MVPTARSRGRRWLPAAATLLLLAGLLPASTAPVLADSSAQAVPFAQDWSDINLITVDDTWSGVPGIIGYRGDGLTGVAGTDPRTILADGSGTPVDVNANIANPNTFGTGGVIEYHITDPVVALQGSATARAPHLVINLDTTGLQNINVAYNLRDVDGSSDNTTMQVALHYRVGSTGNFTDVPAAYVADATSGPNLATLVTPVSVGLPAAVNDQPLVQVRILMSDAPSTDESVGIDDISITSSEADDAPSVVATTPANGAVDVPINTTPTVTFSEDVALSGVTLSCAGQGPKTVTPTGGPATFSLGTTPFQNSDHCTLDIAASAVTDLDANDPPDTMAADFTASFDTAPVPPIALVINEVDYDQPGTDTAEYLELRNITGSPVELDPYAVVFVNGSGGVAAPYRTVDLPAVSIAADDYFVLCANTATVANCDLDGTPDTDWIQNGAPDALGLTFNGVARRRRQLRGRHRGAVHGDRRRRDRHGRGRSDGGAQPLPRRLGYEQQQRRLPAPRQHAGCPELVPGRRLRADGRRHVPGRRRDRRQRRREPVGHVQRAGQRDGPVVRSDLQPAPEAGDVLGRSDDVHDRPGHRLRRRRRVLAHGHRGERRRPGRDRSARHS